MFGKQTKTSAKPQKQQTTVQHGQSQQAVVFVRRTTWEKIVTTTSKATHKTAKAVKTVTPSLIRPGGKSATKALGVGQNQAFYRASYQSLGPQQKWDLYIAGLAPQGVPAPSKPAPHPKTPPRQYKPVKVMYLTKPSPTGFQAGQITVLPTAAQVSAAQKKKQPNPDALPSFPTPGQGVKLVHRPAQQTVTQQRINTTGHGNPIRQQVVVQRPVQQQQLQGNMVTVTLPAGQVQRIQQQQQQRQQVQVSVQRPVVQTTVRLQQQSQQPQQQYVTVTVPLQVQAQQQQTQRVQVQTVRVQQQQPQQQQYVVVQGQQQQQQQQVRQPQQVFLVPGQARPRVVSAPGTGRRVAGQSVVVVRT
ncbi:hypothetical protein QBC44DRAFT_390376 [Cladorrhinum sp. PSN332]|nr:hypothetical protein QBC44DRAFT_390376 [Cladorrhinum sp. PSN332]